MCQAEVMSADALEPRKLKAMILTCQTAYISGIHIFLQLFSNGRKSKSQIVEDRRLAYKIVLILQVCCRELQQSSLALQWLDIAEHNSCEYTCVQGALK